MWSGKRGERENDVSNGIPYSEKQKKVSCNFVLTLGFVKGGEKKRRVKRMYSTHLRADSEK